MGGFLGPKFAHLQADVDAVHAEELKRRAAPELYEALEGAIGALEFSRDYHNDCSNADQAFAQDRLDAAVRALAKARGETQ